MTRRIIWTLAIATVLVAALVVFDAVDIPHAVVLVVVVLAVSLIFGLETTDDEYWPPPPAENRPGGRKDVSDLAWAAFTRDGLVTERVLRRVRLIAAHRLAGHGVTWDGRLGDGLDGWGSDERDAAQHRARATTLLGADLLAALSTARAVTPRTLQTWFRVLDQLVEAPDDPRSPR